MSVSDYRGYVKVHLRNFINDPVSGKKFPMKTVFTRMGGPKNADARHPRNS